MQLAVTQERPHSANDSVQLVRQVHEIVRDLLEPKLATYFIDFSVTIFLAYLTLTGFLLAADFSFLQAAMFVISAAAMYRAAIFIHEIQHRPSSAFNRFRLYWNALCGIPFFMPSFLYDDHVGHHSSLTYGTQHDAEYMSLTRYRKIRSIGLLLVSLTYPTLGPIRFLLLTPLAILSPSIDRFGWRYLSSLYNFNIAYRREYDQSASSKIRWLQEVAASLLAWSLVVLIWNGYIPLSIVFKVYLVFAAWMVVNQLRTLTAHRYTRQGDPATYAEQLLDSNTFAQGGILPELWAPVGLRYHALHHLMPSMPYHAMGKAHRRLIQQLPCNSPYHKTLQPSLFAAVVDSLIIGNQRFVDIVGETLKSHSDNVSG